VNRRTFSQICWINTSSGAFTGTSHRPRSENPSPALPNREPQKSTVILSPGPFAPRHHILASDACQDAGARTKLFSCWRTPGGQKTLVTACLRKNNSLANNAQYVVTVCRPVARPNWSTTIRCCTTTTSSASNAGLAPPNILTHQTVASYRRNSSDVPAPPLMRCRSDPPPSGSTPNKKTK